MFAETLRPLTESTPVQTLKNILDAAFFHNSRTSTRFDLAYDHQSTHALLHYVVLPSQSHSLVSHPLARLLGRSAGFRWIRRLPYSRSSSAKGSHSTTVQVRCPRSCWSICFDEAKNTRLSKRQWPTYRKQQLSFHCLKAPLLSRELMMPRRCCVNVHGV